MSQYTESGTMEVEVMVKLKFSATLHIHKGIAVPRVNKLEYRGTSVSGVVAASDLGIAGISAGDSLLPSTIGAQVAVRAADMFSSSFADMPVNNPDNATNVTKEDMPVNNPDIAAGDAKAKMLVLKTDSTADTDEFFALQTPAGTPTTPAPPSMDKVTWVAYNLRARKVPYKPNTPTPGGRVSKHARRISSGPRANNTQVTTPRAQKLQRGLDRKLSARFQNAKFNRMAERFGIRAALQNGAFRHEKKMKARLEKAAEARWKDLGGEVTEEAKLDAITKAIEGF